MFFTQGDPLNFALLPTCTDIYIYIYKETYNWVRFLFQNNSLSLSLQKEKEHENMHRWKLQNIHQNFEYDYLWAGELKLIHLSSY